jgi:hypothetical protein
MHRQSVTSSNISSIGYDQSLQTLEVEFNDGSIYQYFNVPNYLYSGLMNASSHGTYFNANIKNAGYGYSKVN